MTEDQLQQQIVTYFKNNFQINRTGLIFAVPNGGSRNVLEAKKMKFTGVLSGVSDLIAIIPKKILFIELKAEKGIQSDNQKDFEVRVNELGFEYYIIRSLEQFKEMICAQDL